MELRELPGCLAWIGRRSPGLRCRWGLGALSLAIPLIRARRIADSTVALIEYARRDLTSERSGEGSCVSIPKSREGEAIPLPLTYYLPRCGSHQNRDGLTTTDYFRRFL